MVEGLEIKTVEKDLIRSGNFVINKGEIVLIQGRNGSGKSSILQSLLNPSQYDLNSRLNYADFRKSLFRLNRRTWKKERIEFNGKLLRSVNDYTDFKKEIGYLEQSTTDTARNGYELIQQSLALTNKKYSQGDINKLLIPFKKDFDLHEEDFYSSLNKLSGGQRQLMHLIAVLIREVDLYIIDEPINNLDTDKSKKLSEVFNRLRNMNKSVLLITHCRLYLPQVNHSYSITDQRLKKNKVPAKPCSLHDEERHLLCDSTL